MIKGYIMIICASVILNSVCNGLSDWRLWAISLLYTFGCWFVYKKQLLKGGKGDG